MKQVTVWLCILLFVVTGCVGSKTAGARKKERADRKRIKHERLVGIHTSMGDMVVRLYDSTPLHRDNFIKLVKQGFYDSLLFHRVIEGFMIQGGDPESKNAAASERLGSGEAPGDRVPAEFNDHYFHKKGALAAARDNNPEKASSNCQWYIVQGKQVSDTMLNSIECQRRGEDPVFHFGDQQRQVYHTLGGTPFLDQNYTVFGEVVKGLNIIDSIAAVPTDEFDRPKKNVVMTIRMLN